ncbi:MAG TPA: YheC/YheD family protein, partial [Bacilli bacterium]|nr:YheC/YheD family protein [Bacilli bacterium]
MAQQQALGRYQIATWPGSDDKFIALPGEWFEELKVHDPHDRIVVHAGNRKTVAKAIFTDEEQLLLTDKLRIALKLPLGPISAKIVDGKLHFGPFVGLYALPSKEPGKPFGELTAVFRDMFELAAEEGVSLFVFLPGEVDWEDGVCTAYVYKPQQGQWMKSKRPLPDLVLPKIMGTPAEWKAKMQHDFTQMARRVPYGMFSKNTGSKWDVHRTLSQDEETAAYLPDTRLVKSPWDIEDMLLKHGSVYVKPIYGTQGRSIYKLDEHPRGGVRLQYTTHGTTRVKRTKRGSVKWQSFLQKKFCSRRSFLVQEALDLVCTKGVQPVDFRWLVQKDRTDRWNVTARIARVGGSGSITTNLHTGGQAMLA